MEVTASCFNEAATPGWGAALPARRIAGQAGSTVVNRLHAGAWQATHYAFHSLLIDAASKVMHQISRQLGYMKWLQASMASLASSTSSAALEHAVHHSAEANE